MRRRLLPLLLALCLLAGCQSWSPPSYTLDTIPPYSGESSVLLSDGLPSFPEEDKVPVAFSRFTPLDLLGRCGAAYACLGPETLPTQERGPIGMIKPSGWQTVRYDFIDGKYLYNRCHLIAYQLCGENDNPLNLITGTRYLNITGMLPYEDQVADHIRSSGGHVLYRVTPIFQGLSLVCSGVEMEAWSVEDGGRGVCFHVYVYNVQPSVEIDYLTGLSWPAGSTPPPSPTAGPVPASTAAPASGEGYVINIKSRRFHLPSCPGVATMSPKNRLDSQEERQALIDQGYIPCGTCKP